ncbi:hypothetical protein EIN_371520 [Entamoeba invadens IP1]|uniref:D-aminoacyl-tRNA deacylase n=1 Tax=Entamoeba invadens IP1 TaxID=370355 RepID=A0A0A1UBZ4_ENTIV|nr:hypothetical protein EIN_371520 [Entamoeba invadens IP1]ELP92740.1 hypothetical protein EIN_371520 [Entamoeba invadens IP1]|eukprot:XP_004259511.1 hypothetical protein EIN_371520 [Entamoeba invadens IP1]
MRIIVQRVLAGSVTHVETGKIVGEIKKGLLLYFGINEADDEKDIDGAVKKVLNLKLWDSADGTKRWNRSVVDMGYEILVVSQFTLYAILNGTKPDFHKSMKADKSLAYFNNAVQRFKDLYAPDKIQTGAFGEYMKVCGDVDGPVNIIIDYPKTSDPSPVPSPQPDDKQKKQQNPPKQQKQKQQKKAPEAQHIEHKEEKN